eukprot:scaffold1440_cov332-Pavlova_lutheri.AAC.17
MYSRIGCASLLLHPTVPVSQPIHVLCHRAIDLPFLFDLTIREGIEVPFSPFNTSFSSPVERKCRSKVKFE